MAHGVAGGASMKHSKQSVRVVDITARPFSRVSHLSRPAHPPSLCCFPPSPPLLFLTSCPPQPLVVFNLTQQSESSDLLGGFRPVSATSVGTALVRRFVALFTRTFSARANAPFLDRVRRAFDKQKVSVPSLLPSPSLLPFLPSRRSPLLDVSLRADAWPRVHVAVRSLPGLQLLARPSTTLPPLPCSLLLLPPPPPPPHFAIPRSGPSRCA